ncbi:hypothetical protein QBC40DRAFT_250052 [Triangularia verruculosa]|uniref:Uncharacterized protein n=1 Tax=Triangularia verruculosa TaxID=2587418 RepID=A0AAN7AZW0_9PEZI|nr:hypothetical protein QBC40DRAFT_250052 [Triangularia verruculosa]
MLFAASTRLAMMLAMSTLASAIGIQPRIVCPDARYKPCGTMCCTPLERCSYLELIGYACFDKDDSSSAEPTEVELSSYTSTYTEPDLNTMLITAHDDTVTLTATTTEPDLSTIPISAHGNSSITAAPTSGRSNSGTKTLLGAWRSRDPR